MDHTHDTKDLLQLDESELSLGNWPGKMESA